MMNHHLHLVENEAALLLNENYEANNEPSQA
jgi:hypothetical protein